MIKRYVSSVLIVTTVSLSLAGPARAQGVSLIRDAETETTIREIATPLFAAAGLSPDAVRLTLVNDRSLNAFVSGGQRVFINTGLLMRVDHVGQLMGVIAHETGHIAGGHLTRLPQEYERAAIVSMVETVLAMGAMIAGGAMSNRSSRDPGYRDPNAGRVLGGGQSAAARTFFAFTRSQESSADQAGVNYLESIGQSSRGLMEFMEVLSGQELQSSARQDPYMRTHPLTSERIEFLRNQVRRSRYSDVPPPPDADAKLKRIRAKLIGYLEPPYVVAQKYPATDTSTDAKYAHAFAAYRALDFAKALKLVDELLALNPEDAYYNELKGQMLFETGKGTQALPYYEKAVRLTGNALLKIDLSQARVESGNPDQLKIAQRDLEEAARVETNSPKLWRLLAIAYGRDNQMGMAAVASAEQALLEGRNRDARDQAKRAIRLLPTGSTGYIRAQDIEGQSMREVEEEKNR
ncbi:M48 family metalloprotease [Lacibacterium aquatile]|uniref:M48 family metalloprotease n=1 Tax=Lacibacterium aquatile TaxID=1168082 RepID=A0ABW5DTN9_9PROT